MNPLHYVVFHTSRDIEVWQCFALVAWFVACTWAGDKLDRRRRRRNKW